MSLPTDELRDRVRQAFAANPRHMTLQLAREMDVPELEIVRCLPDGMATELDVVRAEELIRSFESLGKTHVIVSNASATLEVNGQFGSFSNWGGYFNVQTPTLDMHLKLQELAAVFAVTKAGHLDGVSTLSFQFFSSDRRSAFKVFLSFGSKPCSADRLAFFDSAKATFARSVTASAAVI